MSWYIKDIPEGCFFLPGKPEPLPLEQIAEALPHGSGIDASWTAAWLSTQKPRAAFYNSYHAMDENGMYDGWSDFRVEVFVHLKPCYHELRGPFEGKAQVLYWPGDVDFRIVGPSCRRASFWGVKDYLYETVGYSLYELGIGTVKRDVVSIHAAALDCMK